MKPLVQRLIAARELIQAGWVQGAFCAHSCYCLAGALNKVRTGSPRRGLVTKSELTALGFQTEHQLFKWNDTPGRTQRGVVLRLSLAINKLEASREK